MTRPSVLPPRRTGKIAEEAQLAARVELARVLGDPAEERASAKKLALVIAERDAELDSAVEYALRALASDDDRELRHSLAGWLEVLGEPGLAASELRKLAASAHGPAAAGLFVHIGVLLARAGDAPGAQAAFAEAAEIDEADALPLELLGAVASWKASDLRAAAEAYVRAARRRAAARDQEGEIENLLRAFEIDPSSPLAAAALMGAYTVRENGAAADQVLRAHAAALVAKGAISEATDVYVRRRSAAIEGGQLGRAIGAALDERLDELFEGASADAFDDLLARATAFEPLAVRLEIRAEREKGRAASPRWADLGRLLSGPLAAIERGIEAYARAVAADATNIDALHALRSLVQKTGDDAWLVEALVRAALGSAAYGGSPDAPSRAFAARELAVLAESKGDVLLAAWAEGVVATIEPSDDRARSAALRARDVVARHEEELTLARRTLETSAKTGRELALAEIVRLTRNAPQASADLAAAALELAALRPSDDVFFTEAVRVAERMSDHEGIARLARTLLERGLRDQEGSSDRESGGALERQGQQVHARRVLIASLRRAGDLAGACEAGRAFADEAATRWTCSVAWAIACLANDAALRGRALAAIAPACGSQVIAPMAAVAAEELARVGEVEAARRAAEQAYRADGTHVRALRVLANLTTPSEGRVAITAIERAIEIGGPSSEWCAKLADVLEHMGDTKGAVSWARRQVALRPGDDDVTQAFVDRAVRTGDAESLADALGWLVMQPQPAKDMSERIASAIEALAHVSTESAAQICRRALDVLGPRHPALRSAIEKVADAAGDRDLRVKLAERWIAAGAPAATRGILLLDLASFRRASSDVEGELRALARAVRAGIDVSPLAARIEALAGVPKSADAELAWLEVRADLKRGQGKSEEAAAAFRELGAAFWDMADDRARAVQAWLASAQCDRVHGYTTLRRDLVAFADAQYAVDCLAELVDRESDRLRSGVIATQAARAALDVGAYSRALGLAKTALERDPTHAEALETAEHSCRQLGRVPDMSGIYDQVARRALGRFGRRAAHHRAARFFESASVPMLALKHAAQAFIAVPSEGTTLGLLRRTADKAQRQSIAVRTVEHVAELARSQAARAGWLLRAASMTGRDLEGTRQKMDLLLKAVVLAPAPATLAMLAVAAREVISLAPDDLDAVSVRLERSSEQLAKNLEGPDGARIAITFSEIAHDLFSDGDWAWRALERAIAADADVDEYVRLLPYARAFAAAHGAAQALTRTITEVDKPYANVGHALLRLAASIADELGDAPKRARLLVRAAEKEPDDDTIVVEADAAVSAHSDVALVERLSRKVGVVRRTEALRAMSKEALKEGRSDYAVKLLERAAEITLDDVKAEVGRELNEALVAAGRGEDAVLRELTRPEMPPGERAAHWTDLARLREEHGDYSGAADALLQAATELPTFDRWSDVERVAEIAEREHIRVEALQHLVELAPDTAGPTGRRAIQKRLARAEGARGSLGAAEATWREVLARDPSDTEADVAIEALLVARGSYDDLAEHLVRRADRLARSSSAEDKEKLRAVRLRRAAILEQRLGRLDEACAELEAVLERSPGHPSALRWIADLYERAGEPTKALPALDRLFGAANEEIEYVSIGVRRVRALLACGDLAKAEQATRDLLSRAPSAIAVAEVRVDLARASQDSVELGAALTELARVSVAEPKIRSELLVEAAQAAARAGDSETSLARAREAARLAPDAAATQLFARGLEYRLRGAGKRDDALVTIESLRRLDDAGLEPEDVALRAFLLAEAEDVVEPVAIDGTISPGERTLRAYLAAIGAQPLVALGLAERAAKTGRHDQAYRFYIEAVYGNLLGLRRAGRVALAAAESAQKAGDVDATQRFFGEAAKDPETRREGLRGLAKASLVHRDLGPARNVLRNLADTLEGADRAEILGELGRALLESANPADRIEGDRTMREAIEAAPEAVASTLRKELAALRKRTPSPSLTPEAPAVTVVNGPAKRLSIEVPGIPKIPPPPPVLHVAADDTIHSVRHPPLAEPPKGGLPDDTDVTEIVSGMILTEPARVVPQESEPPPKRPSFVMGALRDDRPWAPKLAKARECLAAGDRDQAEQFASDALRDGSVEAADLLDEMLVPEPSRRGALIKVRRQAVELCPGDAKRLVALREAAKADQHTSYVRAIDHVLRAFDLEAGPLPPPPLSAQNTQPGILTLLTRHSNEPAGSAFGIVLDGAPSIFARPPGTYGMGGLDRVVPGPSAALPRLYESALRLLDTPRFALFHRKPAPGKPRPGEIFPSEEEHGPLSLTTALVAPPAAILGGDVREDSADLRWLLGQALSSVLPQNALVLGLSEAEAKSLWRVLVGAFGPPGRIQFDRSDARLAETLWQTLAPRAQRRLKELLEGEESTPFELVLERAKQSGRRVGMFLSGDFAHAAKALVAEFPQIDEAELSAPDGLAKVCAKLPSLADLFRLAVRPEYADARWHFPTPAANRLGAGRLPPV